LPYHLKWDKQTTSGEGGREEGDYFDCTLRKTGLLTYATTIWGKWFVVETEQLSDIIKVWMLNN